MDEDSKGTPDGQTGPPQESTEPDEDLTASLPPEDETEVMVGDTAEPTRVIPAGGAAAPPPRSTQPTLVMSSRPPREGSSAGWIVLIVILVALAAAAAAWYFLIRDQGTEPAPTPTPTPTLAFGWVGAWAPTDGSGGGIVVQQTSADYQITVYDTMVRVIGSAVATEQSEDLTFALETAESLAGIPGPYDVVLSPGVSADEVKMSVTGVNGTTISMPLGRVPALVPVTPSSSPSPSVTPTPTLSPTSSPSPSPTATQTAEAQQVIDGIDRIQAGIMTWSANNNGLYPQPQDVTAAGGIAQYVDPWPTNPYDGQPMEPGTGPGEYIYQQLDGGAGYQLTGYVSGGLTYTVP
jgi:hypothetical protein